MRLTKLSQRAQEEEISETELLIRLYEKHQSQTGVAADLGISQGRLSQLLKELGLQEKRIIVPIEDNP